MELPASRWILELLLWQNHEQQERISKARSLNHCQWIIGHLTYGRIKYLWVFELQLHSNFCYYFCFLFKVCSKCGYSLFLIKKISFDRMELWNIKYKYGSLPFTPCDETKYQLKWICVCNYKARILEFF